MRVIRHPLVQHDLAALVDHIVETTQGDFAAAARRLDEIDALLAEITANPLSGMRLSKPLDGWLVRHGGRGHRITIVFRADIDGDVLYVALVAFGGQDWVAEGNARKVFEDSD
jgi:plasmid stabilization system protein ParE